MIRPFQSSMLPGFHRQVVDLTRELGENTSHILVPGAGIMRDPKVIAEVRKVLVGTNVVADVCRHIHWNCGTKDDEWHQDLYDEKPWPKNKRYVMLFYYPQDTPPELGPTEVRDDDGIESLMFGPAGTCFIMHPDTWHRATANRAGKPRAMIRNHFYVSK